MECKSCSSSSTVEDIPGFNLNLLECKLLFSVITAFLAKSFNLNLLECKSEKPTETKSGISVLISTYWNVNIRAYYDEGMKKLVLISTYWNVNVVIAIWYALYRAVLISTYWNVNMLNIDLSKQVCASFNLNLLECKFVLLPT